MLLRRLLLVVAFASVAGVAPVWAHTGPAVAELGEPPASDALPGVLGGLCALVAAVFAVRRPRRALALALALLLGAFAFETGLHSVHHLSGQQERAPCAMASAGSHTIALETQPISINAPPAPALIHLSPVAAPHLASRAFSRADGRAPPVSSAAS